MRRAPRHVPTFAILMALTLLAGCLEERDAPGAGEEEPQSVAFETIAEGQHSALETPVRRVIEDADAWAAFWEEHTADEQPRPERPEVDFATRRVVAIVLEDKPDSCYGVEVSNLTREGDRLVVEVTTLTPHPAMGCLAVITQPFQFITVPAGAEQVEFVERTRQQEPAGPPPGAPAASGEAVEVRDLAQGAYSGLEGPVRRVVEDEAAWAELWEAHASREMPPPERPEVAFPEERVVAVVLEDKPNACWGVEVTDVAQEAEGVRVEVTTYAPPADAYCAEVITQPFHFVALRGAQGDVRFEERVVAGSPSD